MIYRCIAPDWLLEQHPDLRKVIEGDLSDDRLKELNEQHYQIYYYPNYPTAPKVPVDGTQIDVFRYVFVDCDLKDGVYASKKAFIAHALKEGPTPSFIVDSGNGVHIYWEVMDLDAMSYLRLNRRLARKFNTDLAVSKIAQLMRAPGYMNTKRPEAQAPCQVLSETDAVYTSEELSKHLPPLTLEDQAYCQTHYDRTYNADAQLEASTQLPPKFGKLLAVNNEVKEIFAGSTGDRSKADYRLGHILYANGFTRDEAMSVLVNCQKALSRAPQHRLSYAAGVVDKIYPADLPADSTLELSQSVAQLLSRTDDATLKGTRFACNPILDDTAHGFRLGQVIGLVAGSGVGKTAMALNMFMWFAERNPDYQHFFIPLEQPANEIADRWKTMCGKNTGLHESVHVMSNYAADGSYRHLSFDDIKEYVLKFQKVTGKKIGCIVIDHIGALKKKGADGENQDLMDICHAMKAFAVQTNTLLVMQSQAPREKAGVGDLELNKDAAYGTVYFESYCDYLITIWQPLKRCYDKPDCPTVTAFKFCKIRHKKQHVDRIKEDVRYLLRFDSQTELMEPLTQAEETTFNFFNSQATNLRKQDRKTDLLVYTRIVPSTEAADGEASSNQDSRSA